MTSETAANVRTTNEAIARAAYDAYVAKDCAALEALVDSWVEAAGAVQRRRPWRHCLSYTTLVFSFAPVAVPLSISVLPSADTV